MRLFRPCLYSEWLYPDALFRIKTTDKLLCLTFDDGPDPESTQPLLEILEKHNIKAIFFCNGRAAENHSYLVDLIKSGGHLIGNHGFSHLNGWRTSNRHYLSDIERSKLFTSSYLFRPPFGKLGLNQYLQLKKTYKIIFWDLMPYDFDTRFGSRKSLDILKKKIRPGSIIVLHDTLKSNMLEYIDEFILFAISESYNFDISFTEMNISI